MTLSGIKAITIPEGAVKQIVSGGRVLWKSGVDVAALAIGYTGAYTDQAEVTMSGKKYRLLTLTGSGTLTVDANVKADVWICAGGNGGKSGGQAGGGGGNFVQENGVNVGTSVVCTIGAGASGIGYSDTTGGIGNTTVFGSWQAVQQTGNNAFMNGASGGGGGGTGSVNWDGGVGGGITTVPFADAYFERHSAGGGGGGSRNRSKSEADAGGAGGSNGSNGSRIVADAYTGGAAGEKGGGAGGTGASSSSTNKGGAATYYGSGGGGGGFYKSSDGETTRGEGGAGYQGIVYIRIPYEQ